MGYLCSYVPEEMIHAAGFTPVRIRGNSLPLRYVDAHLQSFTCALCRSTLDQLLGGQLNALAGVVFAHTCDTMQAQADLWRMNTASTQLVHTVMQPAHLAAQGARTYLVAELTRLWQRLCDAAGTTPEVEQLSASIALFDETRRLVRSLQELRQKLSVPDFFAILDAAQAMPRETFNTRLADLLIELQGTPPARQHDPRPRLFLVGAVLDEPRLLDLIQDQGAHVTGDDLCTGSRHFHGTVGGQEDPIAALADYYLERPPCPTKYHPSHKPADYLLQRAREAQADGVLFVIEKFCEPHAFDYALVIPALERAGLPYLLLEMEQTPSLEALRTRLQAFVEML
jgi:benzoyl-CoA reductase/2-hydroxyglutaryl-CoA dehydratase subunit BcrC/BadD/HgdB